MTESLLYTTMPSPVGELLLLGDGQTLRGIHLQEGGRPAALDGRWVRDAAPFATARAQLDEYFAGKRTAFELPLAAAGSDFQRLVWGALEQIPYGRTVSYGELARRIGRPAAARAVGLAIGRNPISIVVPCHRVIGAAGALTGYAGGVARKRFLLELERGAAWAE
jgi:methylated-DNA-[protein]-cysteine S-methyltransferase